MLASKINYFGSERVQSIPISNIAHQIALLQEHLHCLLVS
jgi:hypothetical protein